MDYQNSKKYKVIWLNSFKEELSHIYSLNQNSKESSFINKFHRKIIRNLSNLSYFPEMYQRIHNDKDIRRIPIGKYIILYTVDNSTKQVFVLNIIRGCQNYLDKL